MSLDSISWDSALAIPVLREWRQVDLQGWLPCWPSLPGEYWTGVRSSLKRCWRAPKGQRLTLSSGLCVHVHRRPPVYCLHVHMCTHKEIQLRECAFSEQTHDNKPLVVCSLDTMITDFKKKTNWRENTALYAKILMALQLRDSHWKICKCEKWGHLNYVMFILCKNMKPLRLYFQNSHTVATVEDRSHYQQLGFSFYMFLWLEYTWWDSINFFLI